MNCVSPRIETRLEGLRAARTGQDAHRQAEAHLATCSNCHEEVATLCLTLDTLSTLREEEMPRRIAFVSDKVFEPRWWQRVFNPTFAAGVLVAAAILIHGFMRTRSSSGGCRRGESSIAGGSADMQEIQAAV